jgi:hypothetical protein
VIAVAGAPPQSSLTDAGAENQTIVATQGGGPPHTADDRARDGHRDAAPSVSTATGPPSTPSKPPPPTTTAPAPGS